jgi:hypothetical protein
MSSTDALRRLVDAAKHWEGKGHYVQEGADCSAIVSNYPNQPAYEINDFMLLIAMSEPKRAPTGVWAFLKQRALVRQASMQLSMNCWQFVLVCLLDSGLLDLTHLAKLYTLASSTKKRIPDLMRDTREPLVSSAIASAGDVLFFFHPFDSKVYHMAIAVSGQEYIHCLGDHVHISQIHQRENFMRVSADDVVSAIRSNVRWRLWRTQFLHPVLDVDALYYALLGEAGVLHPQLKEEQERFWKAYARKKKKLPMPPLDEDMLEMLHSLRYSPEAIHEVTVREHKKQTLNNNRASIEANVLKAHGISLTGMQLPVDPSPEIDALHDSLGDLANPIRMTTCADTPWPAQIRGDATSASRYVYDVDDLCVLLRTRARNPLNPAQILAPADIEALSWPGHDTDAYLEQRLSELRLRAPSSRRSVNDPIAYLRERIAAIGASDAATDRFFAARDERRVRGAAEMVSRGLYRLVVYPWRPDEVRLAPVRLSRRRED